MVLLKKNKFVKFEGDARFNFVDNLTMRIGGWENITRAKTREGVPFVIFSLVDFRMVPGSQNKGAISKLFFLSVYEGVHEVQKSQYTWAQHVDVSLSYGFVLHMSFAFLHVLTMPGLSNQGLHGVACEVVFLLE